MATIDDVKAILGVSGTDQDARLAAVIAGAQAAITRMTGVRFGVGEVVEDHPGGVATLALRAHPVVAIVGVEDLAGGGAVDAGGYELDAALGLLRRLPFGQTWSGARAPGPFLDPLGVGPGAIRPRWRVTFTAGYAAVPGDLLLAIADMVAATLGQQGGKTSEKDGDYAVSYSAPTGVPASAMAIISSYVRVM